ncbi:MAG: DUF2786 domain-containing protein [Tomitella sp.]|nr:DUF2786 domain-containing protein [Tomitella sp.]
MHPKLEQVRKLLAKADSVAGTPEADAFNAKAFDLIAQYGFDEAAARAVDNAGPADIVKRNVHITGQYRTQQRLLVYGLVRALHCAGAGHNYVEQLFGTDQALDRIEVLFSTLRLQMFSGAKTARGYDASSTKVARRRWMEGFAQAVYSRLSEAEQHATAASPGAAVVLVDDRDRADQKMRDELRVRAPRRRIVRGDHAAAAAGAAAGSRADIGHDRIGSRLAIGA